MPFDSSASWTIRQQLRNTTKVRWHMRRLWHRATAGSRTEPTFLIIGSQKAGTTSLAAYLDADPSVYVSPTEMSYFILNFARSDAWYRSFFPTHAQVARKGITAVGEKGPDYLVFPQVPERVRACRPDMKLIIILRDPVDRALSHYFHQRARGGEPLSFEAALEAEQERTAGEYSRMLVEPEYISRRYLAYSYLARGHYIQHVQRWLQFFSPDQILILTLNDLQADRDRVLTSTMRFLGVEGAYSSQDVQKRNTRRYPRMTPEARKQLAQYYQPWNEQLYTFLGRRFNWTLPNSEGEG